MNYIKKRKALHRIFLMSVFVPMISYAQQKDVFVNDSYFGYNGKALKKCSVIEILGKKKVNQIVKKRLTNDIRLTPCYWNDSLCYGVIDIIFVSELSVDYYPFFIDKNGEIFQLFQGKKFVQNKILDAIEIINKLEINDKRDSLFIEHRIAIGIIKIGLGRNLISNIDNNFVLGEFYLKDRDNW